MSILDYHLIWVRNTFNTNSLRWGWQFECPIVDTIRKEQWQNVVREMPMGMTYSVYTMAVNEKANYIYTCFNGVAIKECIKSLVNYGMTK